MKNYPKRRIALAIAMIGCASQMMAAQAQEAPSQLDRVEVVGSNIKRSAAKQATQLEVYKTEEFTKKGLTTTQEVVASLAANQSDVVAASSVGSDQGGASYANLRGLGSQYTLVLIDGRRAANQPAGQAAYALDLNAIPLDAIERIEVLKEGASAIYGTDAIGGVINFITKKSYQGATASLGYSSPTQNGGGTERRLSVAGGVGDLNDDGWNVQGTLGISKTEALWAKDRSSIAIDRNPSMSVNAFPGNYLTKDNPLTAADESAFVSPGYPSCANGTRAVSNGDGSGYCYQNTSNWLGIVPETERFTASAKATKRLGEHEASLQFIHSETKTIASVAPTPTGGTGDIFLTNSSPYYPATNPDGTATDGSPLELYGRTTEAGPRVTKFKTSMDRLQSNLEGIVAGWDYKGGVGYSESKLTETLESGYLSKSKLQSAIDAGKINPFGSNPADVWNSVALTGDLKKSTMKLMTADYKMSRELMELSTGSLAVALGAEARREELEAGVAGWASEALSSGSDDSKPTSGSRNVYALYGEAIIPVLKNLEAQVAVRYDHYSDFGDSINPKASFKFTPVRQVMFRGSASTGFRAPTLYDMYMPSSKTNTGDNYNDPLVCAEDNESGSCTPRQRLIQQGGNPNLKPEKSYSTSFGLVIEPVSSVTASADVWTTAIKDRIGGLPETTIMGNRDKYRDRFVANADGTLDYIKAITENLGKLKASGVDLSGAWRLPKSSLGNFTLSANSTYTAKYDYQNEKDGEWVHNAGRYADDYVIFRWKTDLNLAWGLGAWNAVVGSTYLSGYSDKKDNADGSPHRVPAQVLWNGSVGYNWNKTLGVTLGLKNMFNKKPPYSNQKDGFQTGYDPRYSDIVGRTVFLNMTYKM